jgi:hypothetical protein
VVQDPEELVEAVIGRQVLVAVAQVVLAELPGGVAERLEHLRKGWVAVLDALLRARKPDRAQARPHRVLAEDERRASGGARRLGVVIHEDHAVVGDAVDVGRRRDPVLLFALWGIRPHVDIHGAILIDDQVHARRSVGNLLFVLQEAASIDIVESDRPEQFGRDIGRHV